MGRGALNGARNQETEALRATIRARGMRRGAFTLASGARSDVFFDLKPTLMDPRWARVAAQGLAAALEARALAPAWIGGPAVGALPLICALCAQTGARGFFTRAQAKDHGAGAKVDGLADDEAFGRNEAVVIVEDVITSGGSLLGACDAAQAHGARVVAAAALLDREEGARARFAARGLPLITLFTRADMETP